MPIYEYRCNVCEHSFEVTKSMKQMNDPETCPKCKHDAERVISPATFILNGPGWHKNDYKKKESSNVK